MIYYLPIPVSAEDMALMHQIDEIHLMYPFYGSRNILLVKGYDIGRDRLWKSVKHEDIYLKV